jgi:hypothetical protein
MGRISKKIQLQCGYCKKEYHLPPSKSKNSKFCSRDCKDKSTIIYSDKADCLSCKKEFIVKKGKKYCDRECYLNENKKPRIDLKCEFCGKDYKKPIGEKTKYCSKTCQNTAQSSGFHKIPSNGRMGFRKDLPDNYFFKSSLEADYARWCEATNKPYVYEHKTFTVKYDGRDKQYTPDFYHPDEDRYVELKAIRRDRKFNSNLLAADLLKKDGIDIDVLLMHEFYTKIKQSNHYWLVENIENRNYLGTKHLIYLKKKNESI